MLHLCLRKVNVRQMCTCYSVYVRMDGWVHAFVCAQVDGMKECSYLLQSKTDYNLFCILFFLFVYLVSYLSIYLSISPIQLSQNISGSSFIFILEYKP